MIDLPKFLAHVTPTAFGGSMTAPQSEGCKTLINAWEKHYAAGGDKRWLAYLLATAKWETGHTMQPVREAFWLSEEWRKNNLRYYPFYGRGYVQTTWEDNYRKFSPLAGVDLVADPDRALDPDIAAVIAIVGMERGMFTGLGLPRYFSATVDDPLNARKIINGLDKAAEVEALYRQFWGALL